MKFQNQDLLESLSAIFGATGKTQDILQCVRVVAVDGWADLTCSDLKIEMHSRCPVDGDGSVVIPAKKLMDISKSAGETVTLADKDGKCSIRSGRSKFNVKSLPVDQYPDISDHAEVSSFEIEAVKMRDHIRAVRFASADNDARAFLNGIHIDSDNFVATDGHRIAKSACSELGSQSIIISNKTADVIAKILVGGIAKVTVTTGSVIVECENVMCKSSLIDGKYADYKSVYTDKAHSISVNREAMKTAVNRCLITANKYNKMRFLFSGGMMSVSAENESGENSSDEVDCDFDGDMDIFFNGRYVLDSLNSYDDEFVRIGLTSPDESAIFDSSHIIMTVIS